MHEARDLELPGQLKADEPNSEVALRRYGAAPIIAAGLHANFDPISARLSICGELSDGGLVEPGDVTKGYGVLGLAAKEESGVADKAAAVNLNLSLLLTWSLHGAAPSCTPLI